MQVDEVIDMDARLAPLPEDPAPTLPAVQTGLTSGPVALLRSGVDPAQLERLWALQVQWEKHEAEKAFNEAMSAFKANPPVIVKDKDVGYESKDGESHVGYSHATHFNVAKTIAEALSQHGLSHSWSSQQGDGKITVTCTIKHRLGHSESTSMTAPYDTSGKKNPIQAIGSAKTYLERYTLLGITGLSTQDLPDDDGRGAGDGPGPITSKILDGLLVDLAATTTDDAAALLWSSGSKVLAATGRPEAYKDFKDAVIAHRTLLKKRGGK